MHDIISVTEAKVTESAHVWTNSKNVHLEWDPAALYFDAKYNQHYGKMVNDCWLDEGNNCMIKWNARRRRAEVWTVVDVPLHKELGAAYNDPYWYRPNNGIQTQAQAVQIRDYYNKSELPPYGDYEVEANMQALTLTPKGTHAVGNTAPNLSVITIDEDMEEGTEAAGTKATTATPSGYQASAHHQDRQTVPAPQSTVTNVLEEKEEWKRDAITITEEDYILKYYYDKADTSNSGIPMDKYLGLRTGQLLSISLLLEMTEVQLQKKWKGIRCRDFTVTTQPQEHGQCSATSLRSRAAIRSTEVMCIVHVSPMHYSMVIGLKQGLRVIYSGAIAFKGWTTATLHMCAILSFPGDEDEQTTGFSTN
jgi:hypothetical protein